MRLLLPCPFLDKLRVLNSLLTMLLSAEREWNEFHQQYHLKHLDAEDCRHCQSKQLTDETDHIDLPNARFQLKQNNQRLINLLLQIGATFLQTLDKHLSCLRSADSCFETADMAWRLLGNQHSQRFPPEDLERIISLAMGTLLKTNQPLKDHYPVVWRIMQNPIEAKELNDFHQHLLETILTSDLSKLPKLTKRALVDAFQSVTEDRLGADVVSVRFHFLLQGLISANDLTDLLKTIDLSNRAIQEVVSTALQTLVCIISTDFHVVCSTDTFRTKLQCNVCESKDATVPIKGLLCTRTANRAVDQQMHRRAVERILKTLLQSESVRVRLAVIDALPAVSRHMLDVLVQDPNPVNWTSIIADTSPQILNSVATVLPEILTSVRNSNAMSKQAKYRVLDILLPLITDAVRTSLSQSNGVRQAAVLNIVKSFGGQPDMLMDAVLRAFLLTVFYMIRRESVESKTAALVAYEICSVANTNPRQLVAWYRETVFKLLVQGAVNNFRQYNYGLNKTFTNVSRTISKFLLPVIYNLNSIPFSFATCWATPASIQRLCQISPLPFCRCFYP